MHAGLNYIGGKWLPAANGATFAQRNPANLSIVTGNWPQSSREDARAAVVAAETAFPEWSRLTPLNRAGFLKRALQAMERRREEITGVITRENGKTLDESRTEVAAAIREMEFQIHEGLRALGEIMPSAQNGVMAYSTRRALGVVSVISPWNFPFNVPGRKTIPALMAGNTVLFKPASLTPWSGQIFAELLAEAELPPGVFNFVTGGGSTVGAEITLHPAVRAISFTGSTEVGKRLQRDVAPQLVRTQLELGGKNPMVVLEDADLDLAARDAATAAFACAGQWCTSTSRLILVDAIADEMTARVVAAAESIVVGPGEDSRTAMGPVCGKEQLTSILTAIATGRKSGAKIATGGAQLVGDGFDQGCFIAPTVFTGVTPGMQLAQEEIFGPVLSTIRVPDFSAALRVANDVRYGLASSLYTRDLRRAMQFAEESDAGLVHINMLTAYKEPQLSFGGVKDSGFGLPEAGHTGLDFFTEHKVTYIRY